MRILDAAAAAGMIFKKVASTRGGEYAGPCLKCGGRDRFRIWPEDKGGEGSYWCRGCGAVGDLVQFLVDFKGLDYRAAFQEAGREFVPGYRSAMPKPVLSYPAGESTRPFEPRAFDAPVETWRIKGEALVDYAHATLLENKEQLRQLEARGLDIHAVKVFRLGWVPGENGADAMFRPRSSWGLPVVKKGNGRERMLWIPRGLVIPYFKDGVLQRIRIRRPKSDLRTERDVRYYVLPGSSMEPMLIHPDRKGFVVVESELDAMLVSRKAGAVAGVIALGSAMAKPGGEAFVQLRKALRILVALDSDPAGAKALEWWKSHFSHALRWPVPFGKDPGETYACGIDLLQWILAGLPPAIRLKFESGVEDGAAVPAEAGQGSEDGDASDLDLPPYYSPSVAELGQLLARYPFKIRATRTRTSLMWSPLWRNEKVQKRISNLVFLDVDVDAFLTAHPDDIIHRWNFDLGLHQTTAARPA